MKRKIYVAIPLMDELDQLDPLIRSIREQDEGDFEVCFCVNQPEEWWQIEEKQGICRRNLATLKYLDELKDFPVRVLDKTSPGGGWKGKKHGVGMARKVLMDDINERALHEHDIVISLDGDTTFGASYFSSIRRNLDRHPGVLAISVPYYHELSGKEAEDRAILRYEIYMRHYLLNMLRIGSPYAFTALGSAIAFPVKTYRKIGGLTPMLSGEDFYFLQKTAKAGKVLIWNEEKVFPAARFSNRVYFGTGPAMIKGNEGDWTSYPLYHPELFDSVRRTYDLFPELAKEDIPTPMDEFLATVFRGQEVWKPLRENSSSTAAFIKACHQKIDGLRVLQYLKSEQKRKVRDDEFSMKAFIRQYYPERWDQTGLEDEFSFDRLPAVVLDRIRNLYTDWTDDMSRYPGSLLPRASGLS